MWLRNPAAVRPLGPRISSLGRGLGVCDAAGAHWPVAHGQDRYVAPLVLGEGLEKKQENLADEVAKAAGLKQ